MTARLVARRTAITLTILALIGCTPGFAAVGGKMPLFGALVWLYGMTALALRRADELMPVCTPAPTFRAGVRLLQTIRMVRASTWNDRGAFSCACFHFHSPVNL